MSGEDANKELTWVPLESNPDVMNDFLTKVGVKSSSCIVDVYGLEDDLLAFLPQPVLAFILLFPIKADDEAAPVESQDGANAPDSPFFMRQTIRNACGTIALLHAIANNQHRVDFAPDSAVKKYLEATENLNAVERGKQLEQNAEICHAHKSCATGGQTEPSAAEVDYHFVALVLGKDNRVYELDGRKAAPIPHGEATEATFLKEAARVCKDFIARDPNNVNFTVLALVKQSPEQVI